MYSQREIQQMADSFWAQAKEYKKSKDRYTELLLQKAALLASTKSTNDSESKDTPTEKVDGDGDGDGSTETTAAMAAHSLGEADGTKTDQEAAIEERDPLKFLRSNPSGLNPDELPPFDLKKVTETVKKMREDSEKGKSKIKKSEWEKIDKQLGVWK